MGSNVLSGLLKLSKMKRKKNYRCEISKRSFNYIWDFGDLE